MKNIKKYFKIRYAILLMLALFLVISSCEEYLEDELKSDISVDFLYNSQEGLENAVVGLYTINRDIYTKGAMENDAEALVPQSRSDLVLGYTSGHLSFFARLGWGVLQTSYGTVKTDHYWKYYYRIIDRSNAIIEAADNVEFTDEATKNRILGEAKCWRAHSYFTLYRMFNNIFITTTPTTPENAFDKPDNKASETEIFNLLNNDLDDAIANLDWTTTQFGRWTKASAHHLKAKVAMWEEKPDVAAFHCDEVINNPNYGLLTSTGAVFDGDLNHKESLFVVQFKDEAIGGGSKNLMNFHLLPRYNDLPGLKLSIENGGRGLGTLTMNQYLRNLLKEDPNDDRDDGNYYITTYRYNDVDNLPAGKNVGDPVTYPSEFPTTGTAAQKTAERNLFYRNLNPGCIKFRQEDGDPSEASMISNVMVYRLAETYLIAAEAYMATNPTKSLGYLNAIRTRAKAAPRTAAVDMQAIMDERARELAFEGQRFYFIKRIGKYYDQIKNYAGNDLSNSQARDRVEPHLENWPIPIAELNLLGPNYPQNDGYPE
ncbi:putative outer membrane starch-binding protein [Mariniflexile fucanivorans]|uniref:Putative outer membrane starch-binding protein n=1 Tax=Mariniflexile fucanivorans TaxID=264023 RepID=A0A4V2QE55_9FLAO|nr:RagB/SusD family nutrient uptake outer membrane protein [Mariniflexile fucanivorans]TCL66807.1 putative outer membrane starch-binding protein [Mariniflexile fucanivorans]